MEPQNSHNPTAPLLILLLTTQMLLFVTACYPAYSPPVRTGHYGAPAAPKQGQLEVAGAFYWDTAAIGGGGAFDYAVSDDVQLEAGVDALDETLVMGFMGVRYAPLNRLFADKHLKLTLDIEGGGGVGVGGEDCGDAVDEYGDDVEDCDNVEWMNRRAGGGYLGLGVGFNAAWFDVFARGRLQLTKAESAPLTFWSSALAGVQFTIAERVKLYLGGGIGRYDNRQDYAYGFLFESGLSAFFDTMPLPPNPPTTP